MPLAQSIDTAMVCRQHPGYYRPINKAGTPSGGNRESV
jgi:hypothetical protein